MYHEEFDDDNHAIMRLIDWKRGSPYTFCEKDYMELKNTDMLFARKFGAETDENII